MGSPRMRKPKLEVFMRNALKGALWSLDIFFGISRLSLALQKRGSSIAEVATQLDAQIAVLQKYSEQ